MNTILCFGLLICASLALTSAFPAAGTAPESTLSLNDAPALETLVEAEALQPEESRYRRGWGGHYGGYGGHHGGYGGGHHGGYGGGWGHGGGWGRGGGYGGGWGRGGGWGYGR